MGLMFHQLLFGDFRWQQDRLLALCYRVYGFLLFVDLNPPKGWYWQETKLFLTPPCCKALVKFSSRSCLYSWNPQRLLAGCSPRPMWVGELGLGFSRSHVEQSYLSSFCFSLSCRDKAKQGLTYGLVCADSGTNILVGKNRWTGRRKLVAIGLLKSIISTEIIMSSSFH